MDLLPAFSPEFTLADRWILSRSQRLVRRVTRLLEDYDHAAAKSEIENFFWNEFADNYLEMCKQRLYAEDHLQRSGARFTLYHVLLVTIQLFAPFLPHITEEIYQGLFADKETPAGKPSSIHRSKWPTPEENFEDESAERAGEALVGIATAVRRFKSQRNLPLNSELAGLELATTDDHLAGQLREATSDLLSVTRARQIWVVSRLEPRQNVIQTSENLSLAILSPTESILE
jgi:valyl-tRNA synthetase